MATRTLRIKTYEIPYVYRAAKLSLWNFLSLFRDLHKPTRFSGEGGSSRVADIFRGLQTRRKSVGGGVVAEFSQAKNPKLFPRAQNTARVHSEAHFSQHATEKELFFAENKYFPQITRIP